jgi:hypothetical protein
LIDSTTRNGRTIGVGYQIKREGNEENERDSFK